MRTGHLSTGPAPSCAPGLCAFAVLSWICEAPFRLDDGCSTRNNGKGIYGRFLSTQNRKKAPMAYSTREFLKRQPAAPPQLLPFTFKLPRQYQDLQPPRIRSSISSNRYQVKSSESDKSLEE